ncbi:MAG: hypothetical protein WCD56_10295, partial [Pseudolabrys sp.]
VAFHPRHLTPLWQGASSINGSVPRELDHNGSALYGSQGFQVLSAGLPLSPSAAEPDLHLHLNRPAHVTEVAPHLLAHRAADLLERWS